MAVFVDRIADANTPCYARNNLSWDAVSKKAADSKRRKYKNAAAAELRGSFKPLVIVCSANAVLHRIPAPPCQSIGREMGEAVLTHDVLG